MSTALAPHRRVLHATWQHRVNERGPLLSVGFTVFWLVGAALIGALHPRASLSTTLGFAGALLLQFLWLDLITSLRRQNHPNTARLVPGHTRVLREALVAMWLLFAAATGALMGMSLAWALGAGVVMLLAGVIMRAPLMGSGLVVLLAYSPVFYSGNLKSFLKMVADTWQQSSPVQVTAVALLVLPALLCLLLQEGGDAHRRSYATGERVRLGMQRSARGQSTLRHTGRIGEALVWLFSLPQRWWLGRLLRRARPEPASALARAELALGAHWVPHAGGVLLFIGIGAVSAAVAYWGFGIEFWKLRGYKSVGMGIGFMCAALGPILALQGRLHGSRREQALLMLLPGMPRGAALNRRLAARHGWRVLLSWGTAMALLVALSWQTPAFATAMAFGVGCLPAGLLLWRDWSRLCTPSASRQALAVFGMLIAGALPPVLARAYPDALPLILLTVLVLTTLLAAHRWRRLLQAPQAFPVGRRSVS